MLTKTAIVAASVASVSYGVKMQAHTVSEAEMRAAIRNKLLEGKEENRSPRGQWFYNKKPTERIEVGVRPGRRWSGCRCTWPPGTCCWSRGCTAPRRACSSSQISRSSTCQDPSGPIQAVSLQHICLMAVKQNITSSQGQEICFIFKVNLGPSNP